jgi:bifunctional non-homologous end joining protein LigD
VEAVAGRQQHYLDIEGRSVRISNPDKAMFPSGFTKGQVIDYYIRISDYLLPHIRNHPITLKRYPNGTTAPHFYEKDAPRFTPAWVERVAVPRRMGGTDIRYVLLNDLPSLVWSANLANLEIHPFLAVAPQIERPRSVVFDLDPGEGTDVLTCIDVAFLLKEMLAARGLESFAKVSGSKGMQVYAPLNTAATYDQTQPFARSLAEELERAHPDRIISGMAKSARANKVFIDWSQNSDFKTTVAVYSLRAKRDEPFVSLPFSWQELRRAARKQDRAMLFVRPDKAVERVTKTGDLFTPLLEMRQRLNPPKRARRSNSA